MQRRITNTLASVLLVDWTMLRRRMRVLPQLPRDVCYWPASRCFRVAFVFDNLKACVKPYNTSHSLAWPSAGIDDAVHAFTSAPDSSQVLEQEPRHLRPSCQAQQAARACGARKRT
jgi:hypothetical protein